MDYCIYLNSGDTYCLWLRIVSVWIKKRTMCHLSRSLSACRRCSARLFQPNSASCSGPSPASTNQRWTSLLTDQSLCRAWKPRTPSTWAVMWSVHGSLKQHDWMLQFSFNSIVQLTTACVSVFVRTKPWHSPRSWFCSCQEFCLFTDIHLDYSQAKTEVVKAKEYNCLPDDRCQNQLLVHL